MLPQPPLLGDVPTRPSQNDPDRATAWAEHRKTVGEKIRALRQQRGLTQETLALESGVTRNTLIDVEHGRRGLLYERLFDIAWALKVPASTLLDTTEPHPPTPNTPTDPGPVKSSYHQPSSPTNY